MKRKLTALLTAAVMLSLAACGSQTGTPAGTDTASSQTESSAGDAQASTEASAEASAESTDGATEALSSENPAATGDKIVVNTSNPNVGQGLYPGTSKAGSISAEVTTISVMNPILMTYNNEFSVARHVWDCLVKFDQDNNIIPGAAESWESSEDGLKWTFHIRPGIKWVDSTGAEIGELTANDFVFAWHELLNPENAAEYYTFATIFKNAQAYYDYLSGESTEEVKIEDVGFKATDDYTLEIELETYLPYFIQYVKFEVMSPICQKLYEEVGADNYGTSPETLAYCGAFYMSEWITESSITMQKNPLWYNADSVSLEELKFIKYSDTNTKYNAFLGGELDMMDCTGEQRAAFEAEGYEVSSYVGGYSYFAWMNTTDASDLRSKSLRHAISEALDRQQIIDTVFKNDNEPSQCLTLGITGVNTPSFAEAVVADNGGPLYKATADPDAAKEYLTAALEELGYSDASEIKISLMTSEGTQNELLSQVIQEQLRTTLGIEMDIEVLTITEWRARRNELQFDWCVGGWGPDYNDPMTDLDLMLSTNGNNHTGYANPEYDALIESTKSETDPAAREKIFFECEYMIAEDLPVIPLYWRHEDFVASEKMAGGYIRMPFQAYNLIYTQLAE